MVLSIVCKQYLRNEKLHHPQQWWGNTMQVKQAVGCSKRFVFLYIIHTLVCCPWEQILRKHCVFLLQNSVMFEQSQHVNFPQQWPTLHMCENKMGFTQDFMCDWKAFKEIKEGKSHTPPYDAKEELFSIWLNITWTHVIKLNLVPAYNRVFVTHIIEFLFFAVNNTALFFKTEGQCQSLTERSASAAAFLSLNLKLIR